ncbi:DUF2935 domain-containing protein [Sediminibacillus dalangtanensis]|uniref:DUF2935 domain-containing protein n=1 Tax=Sediminibacillus dalangtanensis TaxID=2729421 RepID=A0ABX7VMR1_9BACI|nr:DUF2935 domain-containing protein [Sediminibacillus dalangtanensis]QTM98099.1 DUF2935 domain-containing protein [Sediminibacillus dalangtanensis]
MGDFIESAMFEHRFWLQVLGDHARFIRDSLYPSERKDVELAKRFVNRFDTLLEETETITHSNVIAFTKQAESAVDEMKGFKLSIIERHLTGKIGIHLTPTFINHMVNELEEYQLVIRYLKQGESPPIFHELHHHLIWLLDASGHAGAINDELDGVEKRLKKKSKDFSKHFDQFYIKAVELTGYLRTNLESFPALNRFNSDVQIEINLFKTFLHELEEMELSETVLGTFSGLMADHMYREECYYLMKLAESTQSAPPDCDPTSPRLKDPH